MDECKPLPTSELSSAVLLAERDIVTSMTLRHTVRSSLDTNPNGHAVQMDDPGELAAVPFEQASHVATMARPKSRGLHSSTLQLNLCAFCVTGRAMRGCFGGV